MYKFFFNSKMNNITVIENTATEYVKTTFKIFDISKFLAREFTGDFTPIIKDLQSRIGTTLATEEEFKRPCFTCGDTKQTFEDLLLLAKGRNLLENYANIKCGCDTVDISGGRVIFYNEDAFRAPENYVEGRDDIEKPIVEELGLAADFNRKAIILTKNGKAVGGSQILGSEGKSDFKAFVEYLGNMLNPNELIDCLSK